MGIRRSDRTLAKLIERVRTTRPDVDAALRTRLERPSRRMMGRSASPANHTDHPAAVAFILADMDPIPTPRRRPCSRCQKTPASTTRIGLRLARKWLGW